MSVSKVLYKSFYWKIVHFILSLLTTICLAHILKPAVSAAFYSLLYLFSIMTVLFSLGLDIGFSFLITRKELTPENAGVIILAITITAILICIPLMYFFYRPVFPITFNKVEIALLSGLQVAGSILTLLSNAVLTAFQKNHIATKILVLFNAILLLIILMINECTDITQIIPDIFYTWYIVNFAQGVVLFLYTFNKHGIFSKWRSVTFFKIIRFSFQVFIINFIFLTSAKALIFILPYLVSAGGAGNYIQAYKLIEYMNTIVAFVYFPVVALSAGNGEKTQEIILFLVRVFNTITVLFSIVSISFGHIIFPFIFGPSFSAMYGIFLCLIPALIASCSSTFFTACFFGKGYLKYNLLSAIVSLVSLLIFFFPLTYFFSVKGAAIAQSSSYLISLLFDIYLFKKIFEYKVKDMLFIKRRDLLLLYSFFERRYLAARDI